MTKRQILLTTLLLSALPLSGAAAQETMQDGMQDAARDVRDTVQLVAQDAAQVAVQDMERDAVAAQDRSVDAVPADTLSALDAGSVDAKRLRTRRSKTGEHARFLPVRKRIDREINKIRYVYKGEVMLGLTASYGTLSTEDADFLVILDNINASGTITTIRPSIGYFYRDNRCVGMRFGYTHINGKIDPGGRFDLGDSNDVATDIPYLSTRSDNFSFGFYHRTYAGLDPAGRFGLFAELELTMSTGNSEFTYENDGELKSTFSENMQARFSFNPGAAVYIFPNVCATLSFGLGGLQYSYVTQKDAEGNKIGSRSASKMRFRLNLAAINIGMNIHLWGKKRH